MDAEDYDDDTAMNCNVYFYFYITAKLTLLIKIVSFSERSRWANDRGNKKGWRLYGKF